MTTILYGIAAIVVLVNVVLGVFSGSFLTFIMYVVGSLVVAVIFITFATIIANQEALMDRLEIIEQRIELTEGIPLHICSKCKYEYEPRLTSCPNCGNKER